MDYLIKTQDLGDGTLQYLIDYCKSGIKQSNMIDNKNSFIRLFIVLLKEKLDRNEC